MRVCYSRNGFQKDRENFPFNVFWGDEAGLLSFFSGLFLSESWKGGNSPLPETPETHNQQTQGRRRRTHAHYESSLTIMMRRASSRLCSSAQRMVRSVLSWAELAKARESAPPHQLFIYHQPSLPDTFVGWVRRPIATFLTLLAIGELD